MNDLFRKALLLAALLPAPAFAHAFLTSPLPRNNIANKIGPCGITRGTSFTTYLPGETITVSWNETVYHPGHFRIAFSPATDKNFDQNVLLDSIPHPTVTTPLPLLYSRTIQLPNTPCTGCTLQLIQVMTDTNSNYFSCANLHLVTSTVDAGNPIDAGSTEDAGVQMDAGEPVADSGSGGGGGGGGGGSGAGGGGGGGIASGSIDGGGAPRNDTPISGSGCGANAAGSTLGGVFTLLVSLGLARRRASGK